MVILTLFSKFEVNRAKNGAKIVRKRFYTHPRVSVTKLFKWLHPMLRSNDGGPGEKEMMVVSPGTEEEMEVWGYQASTLKYALLLLGKCLYRDGLIRVFPPFFSHVPQLLDIVLLTKSCKRF